MVSVMAGAAAARPAKAAAAIAKRILIDLVFLKGDVVGFNVECWRDREKTVRSSNEWTTGVKKELTSELFGWIE